MKLTSKGRYAVMAMADLANIKHKQTTNLTEISLRQGISISFLEQIFLKLKKNGIVNSVRGNKGGYILSKNASDIKISEIFIAVDEKIKTIGCEKNSDEGCNGKSSKCITHDLWDELENHINSFFEKKSLEDLIHNKKENRL